MTYSFQKEDLQFVYSEIFIFIYIQYLPLPGCYIISCISSRKTNFGLVQRISALIVHNCCHCCAPFIKELRYFYGKSRGFLGHQDKKKIWNIGSKTTYCFYKYWVFHFNLTPVDGNNFEKTETTTMEMSQYVSCFILKGYYQDSSEKNRIFTQSMRSY